MTRERLLAQDRDGNDLVSIRDADGKRYEIRPGLKALHRGVWKITRAEACAAVREFGRIHRFINRSW